jgi:putative alpha-1,2-mannosidase
MSAWFILSAIGFYPVDPVSTHYVFGTPLFDRSTLTLAGGKQLVFETRRSTPASIYVSGVSLNGKPYPQSWFSHEEIAGGGIFVLEIGSQPDPQFGKAVSARPRSA